MNELRYTGVVKDGQLRITDRKGFDTNMKGLEGLRLRISIKKYHKSRSNKQNSYYHGCIIPAVKEGLINNGFERHLMTNENVHEILKTMFLKEDIANGDGVFVTCTKSTTDLSTVEFSDFVDAVHRWALEFLGITIPLPGEQSEMNF